MRQGWLSESRPALMLAGRLGLAAAMLCAAALYNRFPLVDYDTGTHIASAASGKIYWLRSPIYSYFVLALDGGGRWLWPVVIAQGLMGAFLIDLTMRMVLARSAPGWYLGVVLALSAVTSLPWLSGQIMPDVFTGFVILATFLLGCGVVRMSRTEIALVLAVYTLSVASHFTHIMLAMALGTGAVVILIATGHPAKVWLLALARIALPVVAAMLALVLLQGATTGYWGLATAPRVLMLARWIADGPAEAYLREECPTRQFAICKYLDEMPRGAFHIVFGPQSIVERLGGQLAAGTEAEAVLLGTVMHHPLWVGQVVAVQGWRQLWQFETGANLVPMAEAKADGWAARAIERYAAPTYTAYLAARQIADDLHLGSFRAVDRLVAWSSLALLLPLLLVFARHRDMVMVHLILATVSGLAINAVICGANSAPVDRFQARVIWLAVLVVLAGLTRLATESRAAFHRDTRTDAP